MKNALLLKSYVFTAVCNYVIYDKNDTICRMYDKVSSSLG